MASNNLDLSFGLQLTKRTVTFLVGDEEGGAQDEIWVHADRFSTISPVLKQLIANETTGTIGFKASPRIFRMLATWCYCKEIEDIAIGNDYGPLLDLYLLAYQVEIQELMNDVMEEICTLGLKMKMALPLELVNRIYTKFRSDLPLRRFAVDQWLYRVSSAQLHSLIRQDLNYHFITDLLEQSFKRVKDNPRKKLANPEERPNDFFISKTFAFASKSVPLEE